MIILPLQLFNKAKLSYCVQDGSLVNIGFTFRYCDKVYTKLSICLNGYVCLGDNTKCCSGDTPSSFETLIGLNYNVDYNNVNYETRNSNVAYSNLLNPTFVPTNVFIISYDKVLDSNNSLNSITSFQIFLLTDSSSSIVIFKYRLCPKDWYLVVSSG